MKQVISLIVVLFATMSAIAQEQLKPEMLTNSQKPNCEMLRAELDFLQHKLQENVDASGVIIINGEATDMRRNVVYESMIVNHLNRRGLPSNRFRVVRGELKPALKIEYWLVPAGALVPSLEEHEWDFTTDSNQKPFMFTWENVIDDICPEVDGVRLFSEFLKVNPSARANIVLRSSNANELIRMRRKVIKELTQKYSISQKRLRFFTVSQANTGWPPPIEYWFVP
jgi:hypothetical protein